MKKSYNNKNKKWLKRIILMSSLISLNLSANASCDKDFNIEAQKIIDKDRSIYQIPGAQVSINFLNEGVAYNFSSGYKTINNLSESNKIRSNTLFQIASETKSFTAALILKLEADDFLSIDDPIGKYLSGRIPPEWYNITIRELLNMTSGIYNYTDSNEFNKDMNESEHLHYPIHWTEDELIRFAGNQPLYFPPGHGWHYSNTNYLLAGMIIEKVTGQSISDEMIHYLFRPLGLTSTYYYPDFYSDEMLSRMATGYSKESTPPLTQYFDITFQGMSWARTAGANLSKSSDIAIWLEKLLNGSVLSTRQQAELMTLVSTDGQALPPDSKQDGYGLGIAHSYTHFGEEVWWHNGESDGYRSYMVWLKCHNVILTTLVNDDTDTTMPDDSYQLTQDLVSAIQKNDPKQCNKESSNNNNTMLIDNHSG